MDRAIAFTRTTRETIALWQEAILRTIVVTSTALALILAGQPLPF